MQPAALERWRWATNAFPTVRSSATLAPSSALIAANVLSTKAHVLKAPSLVEGKCVPFDSTLVGDVKEAAEPNSGLLRDEMFVFETAKVTLPAEGQTVSLEGCLVPADTNEDDIVEFDADGFTFTATGPTVLNIKIDGIGGAAAAFSLTSSEMELASTNWELNGVEAASTSVERQVYLPIAGEYTLNVVDSRTLLPLFIGGSFPLPVGGPDSCYYGQITTLPLPAAKTIKSGEPEVGPVGDVTIYDYAATEETLLVSLSTESGFTGMVLNTEVNGARIPTATSYKLAAGDAVRFVVDHSFDLAVSPAEYTLSAKRASYNAAAGTTAYTDICPGAGGSGVVIPLVTDDEGVLVPDLDSGLSEATSLGASIPFFGQAVTDVIISADGWATFDATYEGFSFFGGLSGDGQPALVAPLGTDLDNVEVCLLNEAGKITIQWTGETWSFNGPGDPVAFQAQLNADGKIEFVYGAGHAVDNTMSGATIGIKNTDGTDFSEFTEQASAGTSVLFTPSAS